MLPSILPKLAQIVTNPSMAVHILTFLCILNSRSAIHANFTSDDFKVVFHIALQYLQHHNRRETIEEIQFSLGQHVRIMCYSVLYMWFLTLKLEDRPHHVEHIVRQLCSANTEEGSDDCTSVDEPTEVCFDFLARYTYANADPKPAPSLLGGILSTPDDPSDSSVMRYIYVRVVSAAEFATVFSHCPPQTLNFFKLRLTPHSIIPFNLSEPIDRHNGFPPVLQRTYTAFSAELTYL